MSIENLIEEIAKASALTDADDLPALVALQDRFDALTKAIAESEGTEHHAALAEAAECASTLIGEIILREVSDVAEALALVHRCVDEAQRRTHPDTAAAMSTSSAADAGGRSEPIDLELLEAWISSCSENLATLEATVVELDGVGDDSGERTAEARRAIHTFKGEAGVLSLAVAQRLCHDAESLIDACIESGSAFPADAILDLVDWLRRYVDALARDASAPPPPHDVLAARLAAGTPPARTETPDATSGTEMPSEVAIDVETTAEVTVVAVEVESEAVAPICAAPAKIDDDGTHVVVVPPEGEDAYLGEFISEAREHLAAAEEALLQLEGNHGDLELVNVVFRAFHTIKGVAGFMHLTPIVELAHVAETLLDMARSERLVMDAPNLELVLAARDMMGQLVGTLEGGDAPPTARFRGLLGAIEAGCRGERVAPPPATSDAGPAAACEPTLSEAPSARSTTPAGATGAARPAAPTAPTGAEPGGGEPGPARERGRRTADQTVKVSTLRMDGLVNMVGELVIAQQMIVQDPHVLNIVDQRFQRNLTQVGKIIRDLQDVSMSLRMVTVKGCFQKMARIVRDISAKSGKRIAFRTEGEDTELDRTVVDEISDPLVHMIRNACDHGIEPADQRRAAGKPELGSLVLSAYHQGGSIVIEIADDGRGLDRERILRKAVERGLVPADRNPDEIPDGEVWALIFEPGFSTAEKVTDISGRGVGMDVVRRNIEAIRGKVEITSERGRGTIFRIRLPLTMAIIDGMVVRVGGQRFVVPTLSIEQSMQPGESELHTTVQRGEMAAVRGSLLPIHRLNHVFSIPNGIEDLEAALLLVVETNQGRCCLAVDEILGQQQVVIKNLGDGVPPIRGVSGGAILGDGRVALILDVGGIVAEATRRAA